jgi:hypothetical protein
LESFFFSIGIAAFWGSISGFMEKITLAVTHPLKSLLFSRILAAMLIANILTMSLCNLFELKTITIVFIYPAFFLITLPYLLSGTNKRTSMKISANMILWMFVMWAILALLRLPYSLEWLPGNQAFAQFDDNARLADLISMTLSDSFPLKNPLNQGYLLSYYYAALIPLAFLKLAIPLLTLKDVLFLGNALYHFLILFSFLEVFNLLLSTRKSIWTMIYLCTAFGGLDWIANILLNGDGLIAHHEGWQINNMLHGNARISSFFTGLMWVYSHFAAAHACVLAFIFLYYFLFRYRFIKPLSIGLLIISGFHSSIFALIPMVLIGIAEYRYLWKLLKNFKILLLLAVTFAVPLFLYTERILYTGMRFAKFRISFTEVIVLDKILSFPIWVILISLVEFGFIPIILCFLYAKFSHKEKIYFIASLLFFLSTYIAAFAQGNNYSMRGMFLPTFIFFFLFAKYVPNLPVMERFLRNSRAVALVTVTLVLFSIGTVLEIGWCAKMSYGLMSVMDNRLGVGLPEYIIRRDYRTIARDPSIKRYERSPDDCLPARILSMPHSRCAHFNAEKFMDMPIDNMDNWEKEFLRLPKENRFW